MLIYQYGNEYKVVYYEDITIETITLSVVIWTIYILANYITLLDSFTTIN